MIDRDGAAAELEGHPPRLLMVTTVAVTMRAFLLPFVHMLSSQGVEVDGLASGLSSDEKLSLNFANAHEAHWCRNPLDLRASARGFVTAQRVLSETHYDIVHVHTPIAAFVTRLAARRSRRSFGTRVIYSAHGFHFYKGQGALARMGYQALERMAGRWTDWLVVMNEEDWEAALALRIVEPGRTVRIPGVGVDTALYRRDRVSDSMSAEVEAQLGFGSEARLVLMIGELNRNKRPIHVIKAFAETFGHRPDVHLAILGDGDLRSECEEVIADLGLRDTVHLLGQVLDVRPYIARASATVLYSAREGLPVSAMESLSMETPVIGSDIRGLRDLLRDGAGWLVDPHDLGSLATAMTESVGDPDESLRKGRVGRELIVSTYDIAAVLKAYGRLYAEVLSDGPN